MFLSVEEYVKRFTMGNVSLDLLYEVFKEYDLGMIPGKTDYLIVNDKGRKFIDTVSMYEWKRYNYNDSSLNFSLIKFRGGIQYLEPILRRLCSKYNISEGYADRDLHDVTEAFYYYLQLKEKLL